MTEDQEVTEEKAKTLITKSQTGLTQRRGGTQRKSKERKKSERLFRFGFSPNNSKKALKLKAEDGVKPKTFGIVPVFLRVLCVSA